VRLELLREFIGKLALSVGPQARLDVAKQRSSLRAIVRVHRSEFTLASVGLAQPVIAP
jgi:hypothetical protein